MARTTELSATREFQRGLDRAALTDWVAPDIGQENLRRSYLAHLDAHPNGWSRACPGAHLTSSALICAPMERAVLLTLHGKLGRWLQTGGHIEPGDHSLPAAALREAEEESGLAGLAIDPVPLRLDRHEVPCGPVRPTFHLDVQFLVRAPSVRPPVIGAESRDLGWFAVDALPDTDDSVRALVATAADRLGW